MALAWLYFASVWLHTASMPEFDQNMFCQIGNFLDNQSDQSYDVILTSQKRSRKIARSGKTEIYQISSDQNGSDF